MAIQITGGITFDGGINFSTPAVVPPDGLTPETASTSAWRIKQDYPASTDGLYWIKNDNINAGVPVQIYADMTILGGGWTLLVQSTGYVWPSDIWDNAAVLQRNTSSPPATLESYDTLSSGMNPSKNYSILGWANYIKKNVSEGQSTFDYMIDAAYHGRNGAAYTANENYSFVETYIPGTSPAFGDYNLGGAGFRKNITELDHFPAGSPEDSGTWAYSDNSIEGRMPYIGEIGGYFPGNNMLLGTNGADGNWWGTLISWSQFNPAPWMGTSTSGSSISLADPRVIWYWVR